MSHSALSPSIDIFQRAARLLDLSVFKDAEQDLYSQALTLPVTPPSEQYILRMMIKSPWSAGYQIPPELEWLRAAIDQCVRVQQAHFVEHPFVYVTVRSGEVTSVTDDVWHVDGFSMRVPHVPEQDYVWTDCHPTQLLYQTFDMPEDFDPLRHNIHHFFQDRADEHKAVSLEAKRLYLIDPYVVHRRPPVPAGVSRCFFRVSFVPIEIEDDTCTPNSLLPAKFYGRTDFRTTLTRY